MATGFEWRNAGLVYPGVFFYFPLGEFRLDESLHCLINLYRTPPSLHVD